MAIEKMLLVNLHGAFEQLDGALAACSDLGCLHPVPVSGLTRGSKTMTALAQVNPYTAQLARVREVARLAEIDLQYDISCAREASEPNDAFLEQFSQKMVALADASAALQSTLTQHENVMRHLAHIENMDVSLDELFASRFIKVRFGRLPVDSRSKLQYYENELFFFHEFDFDGDYYWGFYLTTEEFTAVVDAVFQSLYFERIYIPEYAHGTPKLAREHIRRQINEETAKLAQLETKRKKLSENNRCELWALYSRVTYLESAFESRKYVAISSDGERQTFHLVGFIPTREQAAFAARIAPLTEVTANFMPPAADERFTPPTRLKNNRIVRPFEMFVTMYGVPSHTDIDPTPLVALTYSLLFGAMFGDLGQGALLFILGLFVIRKSGSQLGGIMTRVGVCSAAFGLIYGSFFGNETILNPLYAAIGFGPVHVMDGTTINQILIAAVGVGAIVIMLSIIINIVQGVRQRSLARAVLDVNGIVGLVLYAAILVGLVAQLLFNVHVFVPMYIILFVALPALLLFCKEPILRLSRRAKSILPEDGIGSFLAESFFELFEVFLSFAANTMSFLRVGGFVLSHAGMMLVVYTLSDMLQGASIPVIILGNLFVMALEGLIVGIQVLRLEFYEIFSRFFEGDGVLFEPIQLKTEAQMKKNV